MNQIALPFDWPVDPRSDAFLVSASNAQAARMLDRWATWPVRTALLTGPRKSGRSLLARIFAAKSGGTVIDDAERVPEALIFHAWNGAQADGRPLVIVADVAPPAWSIALPDLRSRLAASTHAAILPPDDGLIAALFADLFARRRLDARADLVEWLTPRVERSHLAVMRVVEALENEVTGNRKRLSIALARSTLVAAHLVVAPPMETQ